MHASSTDPLAATPYGARTANPGSHSRARVLVVDGEEKSRKGTLEALYAAGFVATGATTWEACLSAVEEIPPQLILLDVHFPGSDPLSFCRRLKADARYSGIGVLFVTGVSPSSQEQSAALTAGVDGHILRPISDADLIARVEAILRVRHNESELNRLNAKVATLHRRLEQSEQRYKSLFERHPDGACSFDRQGRLLSFNRAAETILGYGAEELLFMPFQRLLVQDELPQAERDFLQVLAGESVCREVVIACGHGGRCRAKVTSLPVTEDGEIVGVFSIAQDVTQRRESEERFQQLAENVEDAFWIVDVATQRVLYSNPAFHRLSGCADRPGDVHAYSYLESVHPDDCERVVTAFAEGPWEVNLEYRRILPGETVRWLWTRTFPILDGKGQVCRIAGIARDITERKNAEALIREQAALLDHAQEAIYVLGLDGRITFWNSSAERTYGLTVAEVIGNVDAPHAKSDPERYAAALRLVLEKGSWIGELSEQIESGRQIIVEGHWSLVRGSDGKESILCINTDITERKKLETQFLRAQRMEGLGTLAGGIAHDLNNALSPIVLSITLLKTRTADSLSLEVLNTIEDSARRGADLVHQVLSFAEGVEGQRLVVPPKLLLDEIQNIVADSFPGNVELQIAAADGLWNVLGDAAQLHQVLLNLCFNARDAMPDGGRISISAENVAFDEQYAAFQLDAKGGAYVVIHVKDDGVGIAPAVVERIFDPFFTTRETGKGTGLGLSTSLAIVKSHGGFILVDSELGRGSTFSVHLPATRKGADEPHPERGTLPRGNGELILLVDDEATVRTVTQQTLEIFGYRVVCAADGVEGVAAYAQRHAEIAGVLTDMMMPVMDGASMIQVLTRINPLVKVVAASGVINQGSIARSASPSVLEFIPKPYTTELILRTLARVLASP